LTSIHFILSSQEDEAAAREELEGEGEPCALPLLPASLDAAGGLAERGAARLSGEFFLDTALEHHIIALTVRHRPAASAAVCFVTRHRALCEGTCARSVQLVRKEGRDVSS